MVVCVIGMALGQVLFKLAAQTLASSPRLLTFLVSPYLIGGGLVYVATTFLWIWILARIELSHAYPFMALSFVVVPLLSVYFFGEHPSPRYWLGIAMIVFGIVVTLSASRRA
jgi:drug/metabolite transporter (DMT)-like permease